MVQFFPQITPDQDFQMGVFLLMPGKNQTWGKSMQVFKQKVTMKYEPGQYWKISYWSF
jgi:hypothetical protein